MCDPAGLAEVFATAWAGVAREGAVAHGVLVGKFVATRTNRLFYFCWKRRVLRRGGGFFPMLADGVVEVDAGVSFQGGAEATAVVKVGSAAGRACVMFGTPGLVQQSSGRVRRGGTVEDVANVVEGVTSLRQRSSGAIGGSLLLK